MEYDKRGLIIDEGHLAAYAENLARGIRVEGAGSGKAAAAALRKTLRRLDEAHDALALQWAEVPSMPGAVRWLLDNRWLLRREGSLAARELGGAERLRFAAGGTVLEKLCTALVASGRGALDDARIEAFLGGFQRALTLEREELALFPSGVRMALLAALETLYRTAPEAPESEAEAARLVTALRALGTRDLRALLERADAAEQTLLADPAGVYPRMAERSRAFYRRTLSALARKRGMAEHLAARRVLTLAEGAQGAARHVGWWLLRAPLGGEARRGRAGLYIGAQCLLTLFPALLAGFATGSVLAFALLLLPLSQLVKQALDFTLLRLKAPTHVPRLALPGGVPPEGRTLCVVPALVASEADARTLTDALEQARLLSRDAGENLLFALLADGPDSAEALCPDADDAAEAAAEAIAALNARHGGGFFLLTRQRTPTAEGRWQGWERKRGALLETMRLLRSLPSGVRVAAGDAEALSGVRFLLVLDSDTRMTPGAAKALIGAMLHPLCRPVVDEERGVVTAGYGILSPRVGTALADASRSDFSRIFAGPGGADPYGGACSELYMDFFGRSGFSGKGIIDIDAYLRCLGERVPENLVLSHDAVEAAFLRCGFVGDVELIDGFPGGVLPYLRRLERWTRGDWQNLPWVFRRGRGLPEHEKWKLLGALRRSLLPVSTLAAVLAGFVTGAPGPALAAAAASLAAASELLVAVAETLLQRDAERAVRYRSALFVGVGGGLVRTLLRLLFLPAEAFVRLSAALRALWRMGVSHKKLLQWQTAGDSERARGGLARSYRALWFPTALGLGLLALAPGVIAKAAGVLWLLSPLCAALLSLPAEPPAALRRDERAYLTDCARATWDWFAAHLTQADHALPPDNTQFQPPAGTAHRTSPTNIGLALLGILSAMDLGFEDRRHGLSRIGALLASVEALPKWKGHLYNWYDTRTLRPLKPRYVSTVDSGNLCACLIAARAGLAEYGAPELAARAGALADAMRFAPLYDAGRKLFYIGLTPDEPASDAWYDLMASEARLTSYVAVARGDAPFAHWRRLSRALLQFGRYRGMASWTGTMFEYLMPEILLPLQKHSLLWESARFCLFVQQRRVRGLSKPWGVSESAYWSLDPGMVYRYKAHGCAHLALKRGMDAELVLSPYSSFLALAVRPHAAIANLRALESLGARGKWGFWEALDCTPERVGDGQTRVVRAVFAHHAGMSLVAAANLLTGGRMQKRFCADAAMRAYLGALGERVPVGGAVLKTPGTERRRPPRAAAAPCWEASGEGTDFRAPRCCLLAGQSYTLLVTESGITRARWGRIAPYVSPFSPLDREKGVDCFLDLGQRALPLLPDASRDCKAQFRWRFTTQRAEFSVSDGALRATHAVTLAEEDAGERRCVTIENGGDAELSGELALRFRPLLAQEADARSHPAFWSLGLSARVENGCLLLRRLPRGSLRELWLCLAPDRPCRYDLAPGAGSGRAGRSVPATEAEYFLTEALVTAVCPVALAPGEKSAVSFAFGMAYAAPDALAAAQRVLRGAPADLPRSAATVLGMDAAAVGEAFALLPALCFPTAPAGNARQEALWPHGISGDLPIAAARYQSDEQLPRARRWMDAHLFLSACGCPFDLVFLSRDGAAYQRPLRTALSDALWRRGGELLRDAGGGVHLVEDAPEAAAISACAAVALPMAGPYAPPVRDTGWRSALPSRMRCFPAQGAVSSRFTEQNIFQFYVNRSLPPRAWSLPLTNGRFGYLATDCGTGHLWQGNARENQLTPWRGLAAETAGPERLTLAVGGRETSLFAAPEDADCRVTYRPGAAVWEKRFGGVSCRLTAFVPVDTDARVLLIELRGAPPEAAVRWDMELLMTGRLEDSRFVRTAAFSGGVAAENVRGGGAPFLALASPAPTAVSCDRAAALSRDHGGAAEGCAEPCFSLRIPAAETVVCVCGTDAPKRLRALSAPAAARASLAATLAHWDEFCTRLSLASPVAALNNYVNSWAAYQTYACRILARTGLSQCGGAFGFRDQLQDAVNLIALDPAPARRQILRCCARQYAEGDVQHWWHETPGAPTRGLRTRCSDDLLWLPWAVCEYVEKAGDASVCGEQLAYLVSPPLGPGERDRCEAAPAGDKRENVLRHCRRALALVMDRGRGAHGLLRMGAGDWNDGFDGVGGESVWLSWFFLHVADRFAAIAPELAVPESFCARLAEAANAAWDGDHFLRGYYADGRPLGAGGGAACEIDSVAQSWAAFCKRADAEKVEIALTSATERLFDREHGLVKLFDPPFADDPRPGYVASYGPGFRENGGQYTHAAVWLAMALARRGRADEAWAVLAALLPGTKDPGVYRSEPFVLSGDVSTAPGHVGEGGWSWYTGAAGWFLRVVAEEIYGVRAAGVVAPYGGGAEGAQHDGGGAPGAEARIPAALRGSVLRLNGTEYRF